ncbi:MAG: UDP-N-acetylglucosamine 2-epimerase [bacterium]
MSNKVIIVTSTRADYGLLKEVINEAENSGNRFELLVTGTHLEKEYGYTIQEILSDNTLVHHQIPLELVEDELLPNIIARCIVKFTAVLQELRPDMLLLLGDRYEILALAITAYTLNIPIAHIHGGEVTKGALDEGFRHSISKMASLHFPVTQFYKERLIRMGEHPNTVFNFGAPVVDVINKLKLERLDELSKQLGLSLYPKEFIICTLHPETSSVVLVEKQIESVLNALKKLPEYKVIFTMPNSDPGNMIIRNKVREFLNLEHRRCVIVESLGFKRYISLLKNAFCMLGNSSSGMTEAPMMGIPTINIGNRQTGRLQLDSILSCSFDDEEIIQKISQVENKNIKKDFPFGKGGASKRIIEKLSEIEMIKMANKEFYDYQTT